MYLSSKIYINFIATFTKPLILRHIAVAVVSISKSYYHFYRLDISKNSESLSIYEIAAKNNDKFWTNVLTSFIIDDTIY